MSFFFFFLSLSCVFFLVLAVAFVTLFERHILSLSQNRLGPNKVSFFGCLQPVLDGVKLMSKTQLAPFLSPFFFFFFMPGGVFVVLFFEFFCVPFLFFFYNFQFSFLFFLCLVGVSVYFIMVSGLVSFSKYPVLGSLRSGGQSVSFEIVLSFYFLCFMFSFNCLEFCFSFSLLNFFIFSCFVFMVLCELNRAPFDFAEGESELVSGFNTEFSSVTFILLFLGEYGILLVFSLLGGGFFFDSLFGFFFFFFIFLFLRSVYPRYRYDLLMSFFWKVLLPVSLFFFVFFFFINLF